MKGLFDRSLTLGFYYLKRGVSFINKGFGLLGIGLVGLMDWWVLVLGLIGVG